MLDQFLQLYPAITFSLQDQSSQFDLYPPKDTFPVAKIIYAGLKCFNILMKLAQQEEYHSIGLVPLWIKTLKTQLDYLKKVADISNNSTLSTFISTLRDSVDCRFSNVFE